MCVHKLPFCERLPKFEGYTVHVYNEHSWKYVFVCIHICMNLYINIHIYIYLYIYIHIKLLSSERLPTLKGYTVHICHKYEWKYMYIQIYIYTWICACIYTYIHMDIQTALLRAWAEIWRLQGYIRIYVHAYTYIHAHHIYASRNLSMYAETRWRATCMHLGSIYRNTN